MNSLRAELETACRQLGHEPPEPLFVLSRDEQLMSPVALKLGLDPRAFGPYRAVNGMLLLEPEYELTQGPIIGMEPRWEAFFRMARRLGLYPDATPPWRELTRPEELHLIRYTAWRQVGLGSQERLSELLDAYYRHGNLLHNSARVALCRAALSTAGTTSAAG